jgi:hypothetical protein
MTEPRGSARDSSLQDRKAPENCLLRTGQPRFVNVVPTARSRHYPSATPPLVVMVWLSFLVMLSTRSAAALSAAATEACAAVV